MPFRKRQILIPAVLALYPARPLPAAVLNGVTLSSDLTLSESSQILNNLTLANGATLTFRSPLAPVYLTIPGHQTISGNGSITFESLDRDPTDIVGPITDTLTLAPGVTLRTNTGVPYIQPTVINHGLISTATTVSLGALNFASLVNHSVVDATSGRIVVDKLTNHGVISIPTGGRVTLISAPNNPGSINLTGGTLRLIGENVPTSSITNINVTAPSSLVELAGSFDNAGRTWNLDPLGGIFLTGSITGGTLAGSPSALTGSLAPSSAAGQISNVTLASNFTLDRHFSLAGNITLDQSTLSLHSTYTFIRSTLTLGGTGNLDLTGTFSSLVHTTGTTLTLGPSLTTNARAAQTTIGQPGAAVVNQGAIHVHPGATLTLAGNFANPGSLTLHEGASLVLAQDIPFANPGTFHRLGGSVFLTGTIDNTSATLDLSTSPYGPLDLAHARITGGTVISPGRTVTVRKTDPNDSPYLNNVTLAANLHVHSDTPLYVGGDLTLNHSTLSSGPSSRIEFPASPSPVHNINGTGTVVLDGSRFTLRISNGSTVNVGTGITVRTGPNAAADPLFTGWSYGTLNNHGTLAVDTPGQTLAIPGAAFHNHGSVTVSDGAGLAVMSTSFSNTGSIIVNDGSLHFRRKPGSFGTVALTNSHLTLGGSYTPADLLALALTNSTLTLDDVGTLTNTGNTLHLDDPNRRYRLAGGTINGGTLVSDSPDRGLDVLYDNDASDLTGVTLAANLTAHDGATISGGFTLANDATISLRDSAYLRLFTTQPVAGDGHIVFDSPISPALIAPHTFAGVSVTVGPAITIRTGTGSGTLGATSRNLSSNGTLSAQTPGHSLTLVASSLNNKGAISASNSSTLIISASSITNSGTITVDPTATLLLSGNAATSPNLGAFNLAGTALVNYANTSPAASLRQQLALGLSPNTTGILAPSPNTPIGYIELALLLNLTGTQTATYANQIIDATTLLLKPTLPGDANLDGTITPDDYALLDHGLVTNGTFWWQGDFNYDGHVTPADYLLIDTSYAIARGSQSVGPLLAQRESQFGGQYVSQLLTSIPEPALTSGLLMSILCAPRTRKRPSNARFVRPTTAKKVSSNSTPPLAVT